MIDYEAIAEAESPPRTVPPISQHDSSLIWEMIYGAATNTDGCDRTIAFNGQSLTRHVAKIVERAVSMEREACAKIADGYADACGSRDERDQISARTGASIADQIRQRNKV